MKKSFLESEIKSKTNYTVGWTKIKEAKLKKELVSVVLSTCNM